MNLNSISQVSTVTAAEGEVKENSSKTSTSQQLSVLSGEPELSKELKAYPKIQEISTLIFSSGFHLQFNIENPQFPQIIELCGRFSLVFNNPNDQTERWVGAILDEMGVESRGFSWLSGLTSKTINNFMILSSTFASRSKNSINELKTGTGDKVIKSPVWGHFDTNTNQIVRVGTPVPKKIVRALIFNETEIKIVLSMLSILKDIDDEFESHFPKVLINIMREYYDWTDTGGEDRNRIVYG